MISTKHDCFLHDAQYDFYGQRLASCSSDQKIKIWDKDAQQQWINTYSWKAHNGSVWRVQWAHPEFGQIIASCGIDRFVHIWEEPNTLSQQEKQWVQLASLVDSTDTVLDIKFAPRHLGLKLATCSTDGHVRIYEAVDIMNLHHWPLEQDFEAVGTKPTLSQSVETTTSTPPIETNTTESSQNDTLNTNSETTTTTTSSIVTKDNTTTTNTSTTVATPSATATTTITSSTSNNTNSSSLSNTVFLSPSDHKPQAAICLSWNPSKFEDPMLVVGLHNGSIKIWQHTEQSRKWQLVQSLDGYHDGTIHDISWAPSMGRTYQMIATAGKDGRITFLKLTKVSPASTTASVTNSTTGESPISSTTNYFSVVKFETRSENEIWKVEWNATGTILASSGGDGMIRLWRRKQIIPQLEITSTSHSPDFSFECFKVIHSK